MLSINSLQAANRARMSSMPASGPISVRSCPAENARPSAASTMTLTPLSDARSSSVLLSAPIIASDSTLYFAARLSVRRTTLPWRATRTKGPSGVVVWVPGRSMVALMLDSLGTAPGARLVPLYRSSPGGSAPHPWLCAHGASPRAADLAQLRRHRGGPGASPFMASPGQDPDC